MILCSRSNAVMHVGTKKQKRARSPAERPLEKKSIHPGSRERGTVHDRAGRRAISDDATERTMGRD